MGRAVGKQELFVLPVCVPQGRRPAQGRRLAVASSGQLLPHGFCRDPIFVRQSMRGCSARLSDLMQSPLLEAIMLPSARGRAGQERGGLLEGEGLCLQQLVPCAQLRRLRTGSSPGLPAAVVEANCFHQMEERSSIPPRDSFLTPDPNTDSSRPPRPLLRCVLCRGC